MGGVAGSLFIAHTDVSDTFLLSYRCKPLDRKADDAKNIVDALLLKASRHEGCTSYGPHSLPLLVDDRLS